MSWYDAARSADYSLSTGEMALALSTIPSARRNNAWLLALGVPLAVSGVREAMRRNLRAPLTGNLWTMAAPLLIGGVGAIGLLATRQSSIRPRVRCCY